MNIQEKIDKYLNERKTIGIGDKVKDVYYEKNRQILVIETDKNFDAVIVCSGGNDPTFAKGSPEDMIGHQIRKMKRKNYEIEFTLDNGKKIIIEDDTGGEGIEIKIRGRK